MARATTCKAALWTASFLLGLSAARARTAAAELSPQDDPVSPGEIAVSIDVKDVDVRDVLRALARQGNVNLAISEAVKGRITIRLEQVSWAQALDAVIQTAQLAAKREANLITVTAPAETPPPQNPAPAPLPLQTKVLTFRFANAKTVREAFKARLSPQGSVTVDEDTNSLIVSDTPQNLDHLAALAADIDLAPRQAMISVVIADTTLHNETDVGVNWELTRTGEHSILKLAQTLAGTTAGGGTVTYQVLSGKWTASDFVRALEVAGNARILARSEILVLSAKTASIATVEEIPYQERTETAQGGQIGTTAFKEAGVKLHVTPRITDDGRILLHVFVEQSAATGESLSEIPIINTRKADTTLLLSDGEAVLIGGLRRKDQVKTVRQVPILGHIPLLGYLFRYTSTSVANKELVVFLTPHLFNDASRPTQVSGVRSLAAPLAGARRASPTANRHPTPDTRHPTPDLEERVDGMAKDLRAGNVAGIRRRLSGLRQRLRQPE